MAELLIYIVPVFAGIIGSKYLGRLANFILMMVVFQLAIAVLMGAEMFALRLEAVYFLSVLFMPYTVLCIIPAVVGMIGGSQYFHLGKFSNAILIIAVFCLGGGLLAYPSRGTLR